MAGQSTTGDVVMTGRMMVQQANSGIRRGPGQKNLGPTAAKKPNPAPSIRSMGGMNIKGPDKGAGGS